MHARCAVKIVNCPISTCTTLRNNDVIVTLLKNAVFAKEKRHNLFYIYCGFQIRRI